MFHLVVLLDYFDDELQKYDVSRLWFLLLYSNQSPASVRIHDKVLWNFVSGLFYISRPFIPHFETTRSFWNETCSASVIFFFHWHEQLKLLVESNLQPQFFP